jgi:hypothetical protein
VFLSSDTGNTWTAVNNGITDGNVRSIVVNGNNIFAGSGNSGAGTGAIFLSTNDGSSWNNITPGSSSLDILKLFSFGTDIFASTANGLYFSSDTGTTWSPRNNGLPGNWINCFVANGSDIYLGTTNGGLGGVYFSSDTGMSWVAVNNGLPIGPVVSSLYTLNGNIFAGLSVFPNKNGIYASINNGNNWTNVSADLTNLNIWSLDAIGNDLFVGTSGSVFKRSITQIISSLGIKESSITTPDFEIYPNPTSDYFILQLKTASKNAFVEIYNLMGECIYKESISNELINNIHCEQISSGIYFVKVFDSEKIYYEKLIVEH